MATPQQMTPEEEFAALALAATQGVGSKTIGAADVRDDIRTRAGQAGTTMLEATSAYTAEHSDDVVIIADALCDEMSIAGSDRGDLLAAARLHDIGKTSIPLEVVEKVGPLTDEEWELMKGHTIAGERILSAIPELATIGTIVRHSHERWDGGGYADGLAGEEIPLASRVIFCADSFDAIRCSRPYRDGRSAAESLGEVKRNAGTQFDPDVVAALVDVTRKLRLVPVGRRTGTSSRLASLLMIVAVGATGSAVARTGLLDGSRTAGAAQRSAPAITSCVSFDCSALLKVSLSDQFRVDGSRAGDAAASASSAGLLPDGPAPGSGEGAATGGAPDTAQLPGSAEAQSPVDQAGPAPSHDNGAPASGDQGGGSPDGSTSGSPTSSNGNSGNGNSGNSGHPHGGPPGQTGQHPQGGPPGQLPNVPSLPSVSNVPPQHPQGGPPGQTGVHPQGGPPGQAKKP